MTNVRSGVKGFVAKPIEDRFWEKVDRAAPDDCWLWTASTNGRYGLFWLNGRKVKAHRMAWRLLRGSPPKGKMACHTCDTPACVNPAHIFWGTMSDNINDAVQKGRHKAVGYSNRTHCKRGHPFSGDNLLIRAHDGYRQCRECKRMHNAARKWLNARALTETEGGE